MKQILFLLFIATKAWAQSPDMEAIKGIPEEKYQTLLTRFEVADTSLVLTDLQTIYYGFTSEPAYDPGGFIPIETRIRNYNNFKEPQKAIGLADSLLAFYPVSLVALFEKSYACSLLKMKEEEWLANKKYNALLYVITHSGTGNSIESPLVVISPNDEFDVIRFYGFTAKAYNEVTENGKVFDVLELKKNKAKKEKMFFDITLPTKLKEQKEVERLKNK